jgi:Ca-activated chloride channel family protein
MTAVLAALVNGGIVSALVTVAVWLALRVTPRRRLNAATRYAVWWAALAVAVTLQALYLPRDVAGRTTSPSVSDLAKVPVLQGAPPVEESADSIKAAPPADAPKSRPLFPVEIAGGRLPRWIVTAWIVTTVLMLVRLSLSCVLLERRKARACDAPAPLAAHREEWLSRCGSARRRVRLAVSAEIGAPMVAGPFRPSILLPARLLDELGECELDQIGLHEAAHLARGDDYALICQRVLEALFALHPVVHWIARRIDLEREIACDDFVVEATGRPRPYAACLTRVVELTGGVRASLVAAAATEERSHLATRVEMLLDKNRRTGTHLLKMRLAAIGAALAALVSMAARTPALVAFAMPAQISQPRLDTTLVRVPVTVTDPLNRFVTGLGKNTFRLFEDGIEQEIVQFSSQDAPVSIGIVFDASASMGGKLQESRQALARFFKTANPEDDFFLVQFSDRPELISGFTTNTGQLQNKVTFSPSDKRAVLDGIYMAMDEMKKARNPRKALLVISAGGDNNSRYPPSEIRTLLREADLQVYTIGFFEILAGFAEQTGGRHFAIRDSAQLPDVMAKIAIELRNHYVLGYSPKNTTRDGKYRRVQVQAQARGLPPLRTFFRAGYYPSAP